MPSVFRAPQHAAEPGSSEFDAFIHSDLCVQDAAAGLNTHVAHGAQGTPGFPLVPYKPSSLCKQEDSSAAAALSLWTDTTPSSALMCSDPAASGASGPAPALSMPEHAFSGASIWSSSASPQVTHPPAPHVPPPSLPPTSRPVPAQQPQQGTAAMPLVSEGAAPWLPSSPKAKRARTSESPDRKVRSVSATEASGASDMASRPAPHPPRRSASAGARRPPPSASQVTESGLPFPVIDTSAKHSSLFVPPDTSGLTKKEARLVKNRAAAFLSRQRKREQFEELACKCRSLARLSWLLWDALDHQGMASARMSVIPPPTSTSLLHEKLKYESEDVRTTLQQVVQQHGTMIVEGIMGDDAPPLKARSNSVVAQLAETQKECDDLRAEVQRLRAQVGHQERAQGPDQSASPSQGASPGQGPGQSQGQSQGQGQSQSQSQGQEAARSTPAIVRAVGHALMQVKHAPDGEDVWLRDDHALHMHMRTSPTSGAVLCTLASDACVGDAHASDDGEEKAWRYSTPADSSEASVPSLSTGASPTLSSLSSGTASPRHRRVIAYYAGGQTQQAAALVDGTQAVDLDEWVSAHGPELCAASAEDLSRAAHGLHLCLSERGVCIQRGCFLSASAEHVTKLTLYARAGSPASIDAYTPLVAAVRDTLRALHDPHP